MTRLRSRPDPWLSEELEEDPPEGSWRFAAEQTSPGSMTATEHSSVDGSPVGGILSESNMATENIPYIVDVPIQSSKVLMDFPAGYHVSRVGLRVSKFGSVLGSPQFQPWTTCNPSIWKFWRVTTIPQITEESICWSICHQNWGNNSYRLKKKNVLYWWGLLMFSACSSFCIVWLNL